MGLPAERLAAVRKRRGITQRSVVDSIEYISSTQVLSNYENGQRNPDYQTLVALANYYHVTTDYLLGASDEENPGIEDYLSEANIPRVLGNFLLFVEKNTFDNGRSYQAITSLLSSHSFIRAMQTICGVFQLFLTGEEHPSGIEGSQLWNAAAELREEVELKTNGHYTVANTDDVLNGKIYRAQQYFSDAINEMIDELTEQ